MHSAQISLVVVFVFGACASMSLTEPDVGNVPTLDQEEYEFVKDTDRWICTIQGETMSIGKLNASGTFIAEKRWFQLKKGQPLSQVPPLLFINGKSQKGVYEFRSGRLIPGDLDKDGNFIPTVGGKIIEFKDYRYGPKAAKIYNLPGKFVRKEKKDEKK
jgi:hypothetical protein